MADKWLFIHHDRVACVVAPLKADYQTGRLCKNVNHLSFAFISPLGTNYDDVGHIWLLVKISVMGNLWKIT